MKYQKITLPNHPFFRLRPKSVAMVGLGPSANNYWLELAGWNQPKPPWESVWVVNRASEAFTHDVAFNMHDLRDLAKKYPNEGKRIAGAKTPVITTTAYKEYPTSVAYPLEQVLAFLKTDLVNSTPAWMVAYAMLIGVKEIYLYGMDFHYTNMDRAESGGQGMAFLLGMCQVLGINYKIPNSSSLLDAYKCRLVQRTKDDTSPMILRPLYGYDADGSDPRIPKGAIITAGGGPVGMMTAQIPRYRLGEAEEGDK